MRLRRALNLKRFVNKKKKKFVCTIAEIADNTNGYQTNIILPDLRSDLLSDDDEEIAQRVIKCPEINIKFNNDITVQALLDTCLLYTSRCV